MAQRRPYTHSLEPEEAEHVPWVIHVPLGFEPVDPDDPTFVSPKRPPRPSPPKPSAPSSNEQPQPSR
jgi:hypothetical protein